MIKRRFYQLEHADTEKKNASDSSSSSDDDSDADGIEEHKNDAVSQDEHEVNRSISSDEESDDSSGSEADDESSDEDDDQRELDIPKLSASLLHGKGRAERLNKLSNTITHKVSVPAEAEGYILQCNSVFKCKICPKVICLTEETLNTHIKSKRHARSEKMLKEGRLKQMLDSEGKLEEEEGETHGERHARIEALAALAQNEAKKKKKNKGRQRQKERLRKKQMENKLSTENVTKKKEKPAKNKSAENVIESAEKPAKKTVKSTEKPVKKAVNLTEKPTKKSVKSTEEEPSKKSVNSTEKPAKKRRRNEK